MLNDAFAVKRDLSTIHVGPPAPWPKIWLADLQALETSIVTLDNAGLHGLS
jgi:hypothetical protein